VAEEPSSRPHRPMDIDDESLAMRDAEGDFDPTRDTTVRVTSLFFHIFYKINISHLSILEFIAFYFRRI
jgi:hypothetical protein